MKIPIAVLITDTHLDIDNIPEVTDIYDQAIKLCLDIGSKYLINLGDTFHTRKAHTLPPHTAFQYILNKIKRAGLKYITIVGNHDKPNYNKPYSFLDMYREWDIQVIDTYSSFTIDDVMFHGISYFDESKDFYRSLLAKAQEAAPQWKGKNVCLTHIAVEGAVNNDGSLVANQIKYHDFNFFDNTFIGHYHNRNDINDRVHYIGSSHQQNFGEDENKGFTIVYNDASFEYTQSNFKVYKTIKITDLAELESACDKDNSKFHARIVVEGPNVNSTIVDTNRLRKAGFEKVVLKNTTRALNLDDRNVDLQSPIESKQLNKETILEHFDHFVTNVIEIDPNIIDLAKDHINKI